MGLDMYLWVSVNGARSEAVYWRKANAIHAWFVDNCQDGIDECQTVNVTPGELMVLIETCEKVLADHTLADELLPSRSGFFFGSTIYDEWYFQTLKETVANIKAALNQYTEEGTQFSYSAWW